jgi:hypothetical protein
MRSTQVGLKLVDVPQPLESAVDHFVDESAGPFEFYDSSSEALSNAEVTALEGEDIA